jgi:hypothetical protein
MDIPVTYILRFYVYFDTGIGRSYETIGVERDANATRTR